MNALVPVPQAARLLGVSQETLSTWIAEGLVRVIDGEVPTIELTRLLADD